jgi:hypothetical protein
MAAVAATGSSPLAWCPDGWRVICVICQALCAEMVTSSAVASLPPPTVTRGRRGRSVVPVWDLQPALQAGSEIPKSRATWGINASPLRASVIPSRRNFGANGPGTMLIAPARPQPHRQDSAEGGQSPLGSRPTQVAATAPGQSQRLGVRDDRSHRGRPPSLQTRPCLPQYRSGQLVRSMATVRHETSCDCCRESLLATRGLG